MKKLFLTLTMLFLASTFYANKLVEIKVIDNSFLMLHFRDGEVHYRDDGTGKSAYLGHSFAEGDDTMFVFKPRLEAQLAREAEVWAISSKDDNQFPDCKAVHAWLKSKPMNTDHTLKSELDHWVFLELPRPMRQGCTYQVLIPKRLGCNEKEAEIKFDIWNTPSESIHVNLLGYTPDQPTLPADLYLWLGEGGQRDYTSFVGKKVYLLNTDTGKKTKVGKVSFWKQEKEYANEAGNKNLIASDVWNIDFKATEVGRYRLVVEDVGCSADFDIKPDVYHEPYRYSVRGYYYMRLGEPIDTPCVVPIPRQPQFIPGENPKGFIVYKTDLHPWHPEWKKLRMDVWDEPHFKPTKESLFYQHRLPGNPTNTIVKGGHSDAFDWDRHLAHVSNIYDMLLPYLLTKGQLNDDALGIRESGNGLPDILDEARNEVDFFLSIRDGEAYSQGVTNPSLDWSVMFQAGCTTMAAWANAANCAMMAEAFRIQGTDSLMQYYREEAIRAFRFASRQEEQQLDDEQGIGTSRLRGRDFRQMAAAFLFNVTGDAEWEDILTGEPWQPSQIWASAAYITCPHKRNHPKYYQQVTANINKQAVEQNLHPSEARPSRRASNEKRWHVAEHVHYALLAHYLAKDATRRQNLERVLYLEASWGLGRNPSNIVEMTGLGSRHIENCYTTGRNDGTPGSHPGQTPFNGTETWTPDNGGDARILLNRCFPKWDQWPQQESWFNQRYLWVNGEFTPRETMRGKMALLGYLCGINRKGQK